MKKLIELISPTLTIDCESNSIILMKNKLISNSEVDSIRSTELFYFVRDKIKYIPHMYDSIDNYKASNTLARGEGNCVSKAILLCALNRAAKIPARLGFADLICHQKRNKLRSTIGKIFYFHGYCEVNIKNEWLMVNPAFDYKVCNKNSIRPLSFNGTNDVKFPKYNLKNEKFMNYIKYHGVFNDIPDKVIPKIWLDKYGSDIYSLSQKIFPSRVIDSKLV